MTNNIYLLDYSYESSLRNNTIVGLYASKKRAIKAIYTLFPEVKIKKLNLKTRSMNFLLGESKDRNEIIIFTIHTYKVQH